MPSTQELVSKTIKAQIAFSGKTQLALAAALGLRREALYYRLSGKKSWNVTELDAVAKFLGLSDATHLMQVATKSSQNLSE